MENKIYTPEEERLIRAAQLIESLEQKVKAVEAAKLDLLLLEMEAKADMMDGMKIEEMLLL